MGKNIEIEEDFSLGCKFKFFQKNNKPSYAFSLMLLKTFTLSKRAFQVGVYAVEGMRYGQIYGTDYTYDDKGNKGCGANGYYVPTSSGLFRFFTCLIIMPGSEIRSDTKEFPLVH